MSNQSVHATDSKTPKRALRRWAAHAMLGIGVLLILVACAPYVITWTPLRNALLGPAVARLGIQAQIGSVRWGWFTPANLSQVKLGTPDQLPLIEATAIRSDQSLWRMLTSSGDFGSLHIDRPRIQILVTDAGTNFDFSHARDDAHDDRGTNRRRPVVLNLAVEDAVVSLKTTTMPKAAVVASGIGLAGQFRRTSENTQLAIRPGTVLQHSPVSPAVCDGVLKYALPVLSEVTWVDGDLSLELDECLIDLDQPERSAVEGRIRIHDIGAGLKSPLARELSMTVAKLLGRDGADRIKLADNSTVEFQLRDGRVTHEGLKFGLPEISPELQIASSGSVGLDETLDLIIEIPLPLSMLSEGPIASALGTQTLEFPVRGTLDEPEIRFEKNGLIDGLLTNFAQQLNDGETPVLELLEQVRQRRQELKERREANANDRAERRPPGTRQRPGLLPGLLDRLRRSGTDNTPTEEGGR